MTIQDYKDYCIKTNSGRPVVPWEIYKRSIIKNMINSNIRQNIKAKDYCLKSFNDCMNIITYAENIFEGYYICDEYLCVLLITPDIKCGFKVKYINEFDKGSIVLNIEDKNGTVTNTVYSSGSYLCAVCDEADRLTNGKFSILKELPNTFRNVENVSNFYLDHITTVVKDHSLVYKYNNKDIYKIPFRSIAQNDIDNWKI